MIAFSKCQLAIIKREITEWKPRNVVSIEVPAILTQRFSSTLPCVMEKGRLRVVSNFADGECGVGEIHTRARKISRRHDARGAPNISSQPEYSPGGAFQ